MTRREALEATQIHSVMGLTTKDHPLLTQRPFRSPHHTISAGGMAGGGNPFPRPGEISLAHHGVLFLDELPEFHKDVVEVLRQPMEDGEGDRRPFGGVRDVPQPLYAPVRHEPLQVRLVRAPVRAAAAAPPPRSSAISASSPGRCWTASTSSSEVPPLEFENLADRSPGEPSAAIRARVTKARALQSKRFGPDGPHCNAAMGQAEIRRFCALDDEGQALMKGAYEHMGLTARSYDRILRVARTIADLDESENHPDPSPGRGHPVPGDGVFFRVRCPNDLPKEWIKRRRERCLDRSFLFACLLKMPPPNATINPIYTR